ncbi:MAG: glycerol-3-phosphate acyltransferase [Oscillospiraceae bacterium]|nr:glycerol-3-phosphate acyltransferase [Clostridia bacterium]MBQ9167390.1 glycerol-3-phosphate acyltransferase [Oscillospiraceae bacterium]
MNAKITALVGYLSGGVLYAQLFAKFFGKEHMLENSKDQNPGTANAFMYGGFWCGFLTLIFDLLKGFLPVFLFMRYGPQTDALTAALIIAAPVIGHIFPLFHHFRGGKGIAATFGCLLGLMPQWKPVIIFAAFFIFYSVILRVSSHFHRTVISYICASIYMVHFINETAIWLGFLLMTVAVLVRLLLSREEKSKLEVKLLWMR